jgi:hypothetical protein
MIQSFALISLCLAPQFFFVDSPSSQGSNKSKKIIQMKIKPELVVYAQRGDGAPNTAMILISSNAAPKVKVEFFRIEARAEISTIAYGEGRVPKATGKPVKSLIVSAPSNAKTSRSVLNFRKKRQSREFALRILRAQGLWKRSHRFLSGSSHESQHPHKARSEQNSCLGNECCNRAHRKSRQC